MIAREIMIYAQVKVLVVNKVNVFAIYIFVAYSYIKVFYTKF